MTFGMVPFSCVEKIGVAYNRRGEIRLTPTPECEPVLQRMRNNYDISTTTKTQQSSRNHSAEQVLHCISILGATIPHNWACLQKKKTKRIITSKCAHGTGWSNSSFLFLIMFTLA